MFGGPGSLHHMAHISEEARRAILRENALRLLKPRMRL